MVLLKGCYENSHVWEKLPPLPRSPQPLPKITFGKGSQKQDQTRLWCFGGGDDVQCKSANRKTDRAVQKQQNVCSSPPSLPYPARGAREDSPGATNAPPTSWLRSIRSGIALTACTSWCCCLIAEVGGGKEKVGVCEKMSREPPPAPPPRLPQKQP